MRKQSAPASTALPPIERRQARRVAAGQTDIEARLDLHGMTQTAAHDRLTAFLLRAASAGLKLVLVITGKGGGLAGGRNAQQDYGSAREPGILRRNVPRWLEEPALRHLVVGFGSAARHHGGEGAYYIRLRRPKGRA